MNVFQEIADVFLHVDKKLEFLVASYGPWIYGILFAIVFAETGLVVLPFLPGDSLLFAAGVLCSDGAMNPYLLTGLLIVAAITGDAVNYAIGKRMGPKIFSRKSSRFFNVKHLVRAQEFYEKHGGKTIIFARFLPIVRTFAPFVAGVGNMSYSRFALYNVIGAIVWVTGFVSIGVWFGGQPGVKENFRYVIIAIMVISIVPPIIEFLRSRKRTSGSL